MIIELSDREILCALKQQAEKVVEEWHEFKAEAHKTIVESALNWRGEGQDGRTAEEAFDLMEALVRFLTKAGIDIPEANRQHLEKMRIREEQVKCR